jgi:hypothetical protein
VLCAVHNFRLHWCIGMFFSPMVQQPLVGHRLLVISLQDHDIYIHACEVRRNVWHL